MNNGSELCLANNQGCRGYGNSHGDPHTHGYGMGMEMEIRFSLWGFPYGLDLCAGRVNKCGSNNLNILLNGAGAGWCGLALVSCKRIACTRI